LRPGPRPGLVTGAACVIMLDGWPSSRASGGLAALDGRAASCGGRWPPISSSTVIKCNCGHRIGNRDVLQRGYYLSLLGPSFIYVRYRCSRCKRVGEKLVQEEKWDPAVLEQASVELGEEELRKFDKLGPIGADEIVDFHFALSKLDKLPDK